MGDFATIQPFTIGSTLRTAARIGMKYWWQVLLLTAIASFLPSAIRYVPRLFSPEFGVLSDRADVRLLNVAIKSLAAGLVVAITSLLAVQAMEERQVRTARIIRRWTIKLPQLVFLVLMLTPLYWFDETAGLSMSWVSAGDLNAKMLLEDQLSHWISGIGVLAVICIYLFCFVVPAVAVDGTSVLGSFQRSLTLPAGHRGELLGVLLAAIVLGACLSEPARMLSDYILALPEAWLMTDCEWVISVIQNVTLNGLVYAVVGLIIGVAYVQLRNEKEGPRRDDVAPVFD